MNFDTNQLTAWLQEFLLNYGPKLLGALLVLFVGLRIIAYIASLSEKMMKKSGVDDSLRPFLRTMISTALKVLLVISVMSMLGIAMTSFIAILGAAGLAVGLALSGTLQNFAGGVLILLLKPFKVKDLVEIDGHLGIVDEIQIFATVLKTLDNKVILLPNGPVSTGSVINYTREAQRRVDLTVGIAYGDDYDRAKAVLEEIIAADNRILKSPPPLIALESLGDSSVNLAVRVWVNTADYWDVYFFLNEQVYKIFPQKNLNIPFPQMDVHLINENS